VFLLWLLGLLPMRPKFVLVLCVVVGSGHVLVYAVGAVVEGIAATFLVLFFFVFLVVDDAIVIGIAVAVVSTTVAVAFGVGARGTIAGMVSFTFAFEFTLLRFILPTAAVLVEPTLFVVLASLRWRSCWRWRCWCPWWFPFRVRVFRVPQRRRRRRRVVCEKGVVLAARRNHNHRCPPCLCFGGWFVFVFVCGRREWFWFFRYYYGWRRRRGFRGPRGRRGDAHPARKRVLVGIVAVAVVAVVVGVFPPPRQRRQEFQGAR